MKIWPGTAYPLGATFDGSGTNFSVFSEVAEKVELCLYADGSEARLELPEVTAFCWHGYVPSLSPGARYGFRVHGPWAPDAGHRCNPAKLLLDPHAKAIEGQFEWNQEWGTRCRRVLDTNEELPVTDAEFLDASTTVNVEAYSLVLLEYPRDSNG